MNIEHKQDIQALIDRVQAASGTDVMLISNTEEQTKILKELCPGIKAICAYRRLKSDDKCYIIPYDENRPIKFIYSEGDK